MNSKIRYLTRQQWVPLPLAEVFSFFSDPKNLEKITPPSVGFRILNTTPIVMSVGLRIDYKIRMKGISMRWCSEITEWDPPHHFSDTQVRGPYAQWHHRHIFKEENNGTIIIDEVQYAVPFSWLPGVGLIERFFVEPELNRIFSYRSHALKLHFNLGDETLAQ